MPFVKLDCGILDSTIWVSRPDREVFLTALLMASPAIFAEPQQQFQVRSLERTGFEVPAGMYGFISASGPGIVARSGVEHEAGMAALERLGEPEPESRTPDHDGRRVIRIDGGYLVLNYAKYRERDYTAAERQRRARAKKTSHRDVTTSQRDTAENVTVTRDITQAEAEAEAEAERTSEGSTSYIPQALPSHRDENEKRNGHGVTTRCDLLFEELVRAYPPHRRSRSGMAMHAFVAAVGGHDGVTVFARMMANLETQKAGEQWSDPRMVPRLDKWILDGLWQQVHEPKRPPAGSYVPDRSKAYVSPRELREREAERAEEDQR